jgi:hypothetical protein
MGCIRALRLPQDLLSRWVASTPAAAVLDLRHATFRAVHWTRLSSALLQGGSTLTEIHLPVPDTPLASLIQRERDHAVAEYKRNLQPCSFCCVGGGGRCLGRGLGRGGGRGSLHQDKRRRVSECSLSVEVELPHPEYFQSDPNQVDIHECAHALCTLSGVLPQLTALQHVGLHNLQLQTQLITELSQVLMSLPPSVTALTLETADSVNEVGPWQRSILFNSIALVKSLRELHMPDWEVIVGNDVSCLEPLYHLPHLDAVYVPEIKQSVAFPAELNFKEE